MSQQPEPVAVEGAITPDAGSAGRRLIVRLVVVIALGAAFAHNAAVTWERWGDLLIDTGRELDTPKQLAEGKMLYRDVRYWYGPFAPYWHALLYRVFGVRIQTLTTAGLVLAGGMSFISYRLLRLLGGRVAAALGTGMLMYVLLFGFYLYPNIFNFILPYSYPAAYGMFFATGSVFFLLKHLRKRRGRDFYLACALLGLTGLCKMESLFAALIAHAAFIFVRALQGEVRRRQLLFGYGVTAGVVAMTYAGFRVAAGPGLWRDNLFISGNLGLNSYVLSHAGFEKPLESALVIFLSASAYGACLGLSIGSGLIERYVTGVAPRIVIVVVSCAVIGVIVWLFNPKFVFTGLPVVVLLGACWYGVAVIRRSGSARGDVFILLVFSLAAMLRMGLACAAEHYGFCLLIPGITALVFMACVAAPAAASRIGGAGTYSPIACGITLLIALTALHVQWRKLAMRSFYPRPEKQCVSGVRGRMIIASVLVGSADRAVDYLKKQPRGSKVVVLPEGSAITYLAGCENPVGLHTYLPPDFGGSYDEARMQACLQAAAPDFVLLDTRPVTEYGKRGLGLDYGQDLIAWIEARYRVREEYRTRWLEVKVLSPW